jgi:hypothetical protein
MGLLVNISGGQYQFLDRNNLRYLKQRLLLITPTPYSEASQIDAVDWTQGWVDLLRTPILSRALGILLGSVKGTRCRALGCSAQPRTIRSTSPIRIGRGTDPHIPDGTGTDP